MADTRLPERWLLDEALCDLTAPQWRFFTQALMFCNSQGTDGMIRERQLRFLPHSPPAADIEAVIKTGRMRRVKDGYQFVDWATNLGQSTAEAVQRQKAGSAASSKRYRDRQKEVPSQQVVTDDVTADVTRHVTEPDRKEGRQEGQASTEGDHLQGVGARVKSWPTAVPGGGADPGYCSACGMTGSHTSACREVAA